MYPEEFLSGILEQDGEAMSEDIETVPMEDCTPKHFNLGVSILKGFFPPIIFTGCSDEASFPVGQRNFCW